MDHKITDVPGLLRTHIGRVKVLSAVLDRSYRLFFGVAALHRVTIGRWTKRIVIVGTFGKTTTTRAVTAVLGRPLHRRINWNARTFLAFNMLRTRPGDRHAVLEVGISKPNTMRRNARLLRPKTVVVTSIGSEHNRSFGSLEAIREEKAEMVRALPEDGVAVLNADDEHVRWMASQTRARVVTFGFDDSADVVASNYRLDWPGGSRFTVRAASGTAEVRTRMFGRHMVYPILAAIAVAQEEGRPFEEAVSVLEALPPTSRRLETLTLPNGAVLLIDDHKSAMETIDAAFDVAAGIPAKRRILVMGEINEPMGVQRDSYRHVGIRSAAIFSQAILLMSHSFTTFTAAAKEYGARRDSMARVRTVQEALAALPPDLGAGDVVLIKGRSAQRLERLKLALTGRQVTCALRYCNVKLVHCDVCPMLEHGWQGARQSF